MGSHDHAHMRAALALAQRGVGRVAPNPAVGCVLVREDLGAQGRVGGRVVGRGWTQPGGRPHAETVALAQAGDLARGAVAYVTLEPCSHHGKTGPCADALIEAGIARCVVAITDPDDRVAGRGIDLLKAAGIEVDLGLCAADATALNCGFLSLQNRGMPWVTMKTATTLDGKIAAATGESQWITGPAARARGHLLRAQHDAILTGIGTVLADDPDLTCRLPGLEDRSPVRVIADAKGALPADRKLAAATTDRPVIHITGENAPSPRADGDGWQQVTLPVSTDGYFEPGDMLKALGARGLTRVLIEAGASLSRAFLAADLVDEIAWFRAPIILGDDGLGAIAAMSLPDPGSALRFKRVHTMYLDPDLMERYLRT